MKNKKALIALLIVCAITITALVACKTTTPLAAPVISLNGNVVSWNAVENATSYDITVGTDSAVNVTTTSYTITKTAVGSYDVTVVAKSSDAKYTDSVKSNKVTYTVTEQPAEATYDELDLDATNVKLTYYLDEGITELDLTGLVATAVFSDESENQNVAVADLTLGEYDLTTTGSKEITVSYTIDSVTHEATLFVTVKERGIEDAADAEKLYVQYDRSGKYECAYTSVRNMKGVELVSDGMVTLPEGPTLVNADGNFVIITVAYLIDSVEDFVAINDDLDGYYVLMRDIDLGGNHVGAFIGATPLKSMNEGTDPESGEAKISNYLDNGTSLTGTVADERAGVKFNGTFDGQGYALKNALIHGGTEAYWRMDTYGMNIFGWVGEQGTIKNLTLRNIQVKGGKYVSFVAGYNQGTIENICIEASCAMHANYRGGYASAAYNDGKVSNVVCYVSNYTCANAAWSTDMEIANNETIGGEMAGTLNGTSANSYIANKTDLTSELGAGWQYFEGLGTVLVNDDYVAITTAEREWAIGTRFYLDDVFVNGDKIAVAIYPTGNAAYIDELGWDAEKQSHYLTIKTDSYASITAGTKITVVLYTFVKVDDEPIWMQSTEIEVTIVAPVVVKSELVNTDGLEVKEGTEIDLNDISIKQTYSDGTEQTIHPIRIADYNKDGTVGVVQTVKAFYGAGEDDYVEIQVTLIAKAATSIAVDTTSTYKTTYTAGEATELDLTGLKIVVSYDNGTSEKIDVTAAMLSAYSLETAGVKDITVTYAEQTCILQITVNEAGVDVTGITVSGTPAKTTYKIGESVTLANLQGITVTASLSNSTTMPVVLTLDMLSYDFAAAGNSDITITYEEQSATVTVTVVDYAEGLTVTPTATTLTYNKDTALNLVANAAYTLTMKSGATQPVTTGVTASEYKAGRNTITYTYTDDYATVTATQEYDIWYEITGDAVEEWAVMQSNLEGYYRLIRDLDFGEKTITPIGTQPIGVVGGDTTCNVEPSENGGVPFTGKFDGQGYLIKWAKLDGWSGFDTTKFGLSLFGYIGEGGEVKNFTLRDSSIRSFNQTGFVATVNEGLVENIVIDASCSITANWGTVGVVVFNRGTGIMKNIVSYVTQTTTATSFTMTSQNYNKDNCSNCFVSSDDDFLSNSSSKFADVEGWTYIDNYGPVLSKRYAVIVSAAESMPINEDWTFTLAVSDGLGVDVIFFNGVEMYDYSHDSNNVYTVSPSQDLRATLTVGETYNVKIRIGGFGYLTTQQVTITEAQQESL